MTNQQHPITPPLERVKQWLSEYYGSVCLAPGEATIHVATNAARWGADQELEACKRIAYERGQPDTAAAFQRIRRPKPPSLKEQALALVNRGSNLEGIYLNVEAHNTIRRALEQLDD